VKRFGLCTILSLTALCFLMVATPLVAHADSVNLKFVNVGSNSAGGEDAYPYYFSVNGGPATTSLMCLSYFNAINFGESWTAEIEPITTKSEREAAWLFNDANVNPARSDDDQLAAWSLFAWGVPDAGDGASQLALAAAFASDPTNAGFYSGFELYVPKEGTQTWGCDPQTFIGDAPTPEPDSLLLLGSGLLAAAGAMWRKRRAC
jgi:hypothetical protein